MVWADEMDTPKVNVLSLYEVNRVIIHPPAEVGEG